MIILTFYLQVCDVKSDGSRRAGRCAFSTRLIRKGEIIVEYGGEVITPQRAAEREPFYEAQGLPPAMFHLKSSGSEKV